MENEKIERYKKLCAKRDEYYWAYNNEVREIQILLQSFTPEELKALNAFEKEMINK